MNYLKNYMEEVVSSKIDAVISPMNVCKCEKCKMDIMAIALNHLPPRYIVTERGGLYSKLRELEFQFEVDVQTEIVKAALIVGNNNRHQDNEV